MTVAAILHGKNTKQNTMVCSYCRWLFKNKSAHGSQTSNKSFQLHGIKKKKQLRRIFLWKTNKTVNSVGYLGVLLPWIEVGQEVDLDHQNIPWATKPSLVVIPRRLNIKVNFEPWEFTSLIAKPNSPGYNGHYLFAHCLCSNQESDSQSVN